MYNKKDNFSGTTNKEVLVLLNGYIPLFEKI